MARAPLAPGHFLEDVPALSNSRHRTVDPQPIRRLLSLRTPARLSRRIEGPKAIPIRPADRGSQTSCPLGDLSMRIQKSRGRVRPNSFWAAVNARFRARPFRMEAKR